MKKGFLLIAVLLLGLILVGCNQGPDYSGEYTGYSWKDESKGVTFEEATEYIETKITLDKKGVITNVSMDFKVKQGSNWVSRLSQEVVVTIDYSKTPSIATVGDQTSNGQSMFTIQTVDYMSLFAFGVSADHTVALAIVCPVTRYIFETKLSADFDYNQPISSLNIENGLSIPTIRTSSSGWLKPSSWSNYVTKNVFNMSTWSHVIKEGGVFDGVDQTTTVKQLLEKLGVPFVQGVPQETVASSGFFGLGGWKGNYDSIKDFLVGKSALELPSLIDWSIEKYALGINEENFFGLAAVAGGTRTVQNSYDGISGATVRMSRESTSYQRALVAAGIIKESDVIKGRF